MSEEKLYHCRLCLKDSTFCYSLFDEDVIDIIESFTSIKIEENDRIPSTCCSQCLEEVYLVYKIRNRIIECDRILHEQALEKAENIVVIDIKKEEAASEDQEMEDSEDIDGEKEIEEEEEEEEVEDDGDDNHDDEAREPEVIPVKDDPKISINPELNEVLKKRLEDFRQRVKENRIGYLPKRYNKGSSEVSEVSACDICGVQVKTINLKKHMIVHKGTPCICELCGAVAKNVESLRGHMFYMHKSSAEQYKCKHCGKCYRYKYKYHLHVRKAHGGDRSHICEVCGKAFYTLRDVKQHVKMTHMKLRPYICEYCNKGFSSPYARKTHLRQHTNEKPFICEICAEGFRQRVSLRHHLKSKHGIEKTANNGEVAGNEPEQFENIDKRIIETTIETSPVDA